MFAISDSRDCASGPAKFDVGKFPADTVHDADAQLALADLLLASRERRMKLAAFMDGLRRCIRKPSVRVALGQFAFQNR